MLVDREIVELYLARKEEALHETQKKYSPYLFKIGMNILGNREDVQECVNETLFRIWNSIPPNSPHNLGTYSGRIIRQLAIDAYRTKNRLKRHPSEYEMCLDELEDFISDHITTEDVINGHQLNETIADYLRTVSKEIRTVFICRYFYMDSINEIANQQKISSSKVKSILYRTRKELKTVLQKEGYVI